MLAMNRDLINTYITHCINPALEVQETFVGEHCYGHNSPQNNDSRTYVTSLILQGLKGKQRAQRPGAIQKWPTL